MSVINKQFDQLLLFAIKVLLYPTQFHIKRGMGLQIEVNNEMKFKGLTKTTNGG